MIIERPKETKRINETRRWILIYGRRKTGKTFLVENFIAYDNYFFVKRDRSIIYKKEERLISYEAFIEVLKRDLEDNKIVVIDEFHRLGNDFFDFLHYTKKQGKLILISSTLYLSKNLFSGRSALLGFFAEMPIGLIDIRDSLRAINLLKDKKQLVELAILLKEPIAIIYFSENAREALKNILIDSIKTIPALIGEIFIEEERNISAIYEGILRAIANGKVVSSEISNYLFSRKLLKKDDPSIIQQYLANLIDFGIIKKLSIYGKKRFIYKHISPIAKLFYYADEKYNISEKKVNEIEIKRIVDEIMPRLVEDNIREFLADKFGLSESIIQAKDYDVDACLLRFKKPEIAIEIKWKKKITKQEITRAEETLSKLNAKRKLLFVPDKNSAKSSKIEVVDILDFVD